jgi:hypothetical protein
MELKYSVDKEGFALFYVQWCRVEPKVFDVPRLHAVFFLMLVKCAAMLLHTEILVDLADCHVIWDLQNGSDHVVSNAPSVPNHPVC